MLRNWLHSAHSATALLNSLTVRKYLQNQRIRAEETTGCIRRPRTAISPRWRAFSGVSLAMPISTTATPSNKQRPSHHYTLASLPSPLNLTWYLPNFSSFHPPNSLEMISEGRIWKFTTTISSTRPSRVVRYYRGTGIAESSHRRRYSNLRVNFNQRRNWRKPQYIFAVAFRTE